MREKANGYYYSLSYFFSKTIFDLLPLRVIPPILMASCAYFLIGLRGGWEHFLWFVLILVLFNVVSGAMCIMIGSIAPSVASGNIMATTFILVGSLFAGHLLNKDSIPIWLSWLKYCSVWNYAFEALLINELNGLYVKCCIYSNIVYSPVVINPKGLKPYGADGAFWLNELGMNKDRFFLDVVILACFAVGFIVVSGILLKFFVREKR